MVSPTLLNYRYKVIRVLASGGFGETFLAVDTQMPSKRKCVIKQLKPVEDNPQIYKLVQERFEREAALLEELSEGKNQIPRLYAYFTYEEQFYLVQEYIQGETLAEKLRKEGAISETSVKEILINILPVLDYIHGKRIVHRDIKPDNIIIRFSDFQPVLIDFGAVKETMHSVITVSGNSTKSIVIGTPGFMPSEQTAGRPLYSSDLYSLGLTAIYLLTGKKPQELPNNPYTGEIIWQDYATNITPNFAEVLDKAIQFNPRDRFATAKEMLQALQMVTPFPLEDYGIKNRRDKPLRWAGSPTCSKWRAESAEKRKKEVSVILEREGSSVNSISPISPTVPQFSAKPINRKVQLPSTLISTPSPVAINPGMKDWQKATIIGGIVGMCVIGGMTIIDKQPHTSIQAQKTLIENQDSSNNTTASVQSSIKKKSQQKILARSQTLATQQSAKDTLKNYYSAINNRQYRTAWNYFSIPHKNNQELHPNGFDSFTDWWTQVSQIEIEQIKAEKVNKEIATVDSKLHYSTKSGRTISQSLRFFLIWDILSERWLINKVEKV